MNLRDVLERAASGLEDLERLDAVDGSVSWTRGARTFAVLSADGSAAEFDLDPPVAAAAARTPDVSPSGRGPGWVLFRPPDLDGHAADRATAWFASADRRLSRG